MAKQGQLTLDGAMDVSVTDAQSLVTVIGWQIQAFGGRTIDVRDDCVLVKFGEREYLIGVQEVGIWGKRQRATPDAGSVTARAGASRTGDGFRAVARDRAKRHELRSVSNPD